LQAARSSEPQTIAQQIRICEVPAPPFSESARAELMKRLFEELGLERVRIDRAGNVLADRPGTATRGRLVVAAHLDTVFPEGTEVKVTREGDLLRGPGIGDNCRGLAVLLAIARVMRQANVRTPMAVTFVANVGEEGLGDLRGMRELLATSLKGQIDRFVSIDNAGESITNIAVGSTQAISHHVQGTWRAQLRRVRPGESRPRLGTGGGQDLRLSGAVAATNDVQHRADWRRDVGQLHPL
jgi:acetylornithine deacetylase/succinyl-diaminopimelate desuccinylase-like protein